MQVAGSLLNCINGWLSILLKDSPTWELHPKQVDKLLKTVLFNINLFLKNFCLLYYVSEYNFLTFWRIFELHIWLQSQCVIFEFSLSALIQICNYKQVTLVLIKGELMFPAHVICVWLSCTWGIVREWDPHLLFVFKFLVLLRAMTLEQTQWELIKSFKAPRLASDPHQQTLPKQSIDALRVLYTCFSLG